MRWVQIHGKWCSIQCASEPASSEFKKFKWGQLLSNDVKLEKRLQGLLKGDKNYTDGRSSADLWAYI